MIIKTTNFKVVAFKTLPFTFSKHTFLMNTVGFTTEKTNKMKDFRNGVAARALGILR